MVFVAPAAHTVSHKPPQSALRHERETEAGGAGLLTTHCEPPGGGLTVTRRRCPHPVALPAGARPPNPAPSRTTTLVSDSDGEPGAQAPGGRLLTARAAHTLALTRGQLSAAFQGGSSPRPTNTISVNPASAPQLWSAAQAPGASFRARPRGPRRPQGNTASRRVELGAGDGLGEREEGPESPGATG